MDTKVAFRLLKQLGCPVTKTDSTSFIEISKDASPALFNAFKTFGLKEVREGIIRFEKAELGSKVDDISDRLWKGKLAGIVRFSAFDPNPPPPIERAVIKKVNRSVDKMKTVTPKKVIEEPKKNLHRKVTQFKRAASMSEEEVLEIIQAALPEESRRSLTEQKLHANYLARPIQRETPQNKCANFIRTGRSLFVGRKYPIPHLSLTPPPLSLNLKSVDIDSLKESINRLSVPKSSRTQKNGNELLQENADLSISEIYLKDCISGKTIEKNASKPVKFQQQKQSIERLSSNISSFMMKRINESLQLQENCPQLEGMSTPNPVHDEESKQKQSNAQTTNQLETCLKRIYNIARRVPGIDEWIADTISVICDIPCEHPLQSGCFNQLDIRLLEIMQLVIPKTIQVCRQKEHLLDVISLKLINEATRMRAKQIEEKERSRESAVNMVFKGARSTIRC